MRCHVLALALALLPALASAQVEKFARSEKGFTRDLKRIQNTPRITSLDKLLESRSPLTGTLVGKGGEVWQMHGEGSRNFSVDLGGGCKISGRVQRYENPIASVTKLYELAIERGGKRVNVMPGEVPININGDTSFYYGSGDGRIDWHGPVSKFSLLSLFHELGHAKDFRGMTDPERAAFSRIYDRKSNDETLTAPEKRAMVGFERRAWASALRQARALRAEHGIDILGGAPRGELMQTIRGCLKGYYDYQGKKD